MKYLLRIVALAVAFIPGLAGATTISAGDLTYGGSVAGAVDNSSAWITSSALDGNAVNFWTLHADAGNSVSVIVNSFDIEFGVSLYQGLVDDFELLFAGFNNSGNFGDNIFVAGTNPVTGLVGTSLLDIVFPTTGFYTLAVGGEAGLDFGGRFAYTMDVTKVPEPGVVVLLAMGLGMLLLARRYRFDR
ncbi:MAG TPA: PEP-CTERM sorting domain-containing protein [Steroidobacteraceae bacterium]|nr:PEP-CTERM sorting domain-containing protein [Steroidobacteraceae bacterium]